MTLTCQALQRWTKRSMGRQSYAKQYTEWGQTSYWQLYTQALEKNIGYCYKYTASAPGNTTRLKNGNRIFRYDPSNILPGSEEYTAQVMFTG